MVIVLAALGVVSLSTARRSPDLVDADLDAIEIAAHPVSSLSASCSDSAPPSMTSRYHAALAFGVRASVSKSTCTIPKRWR